MRILWFSGVQLPAVTGDPLTRAGWQEGLRKAFQEHIPEVELIIASFGLEEYPPFQEGNAIYCNIPLYGRPATRWGRVRSNWQHAVSDRAALQRCLEIADQYQPALIFIFGTENPFGLLADQYGSPVMISIQAVLNGLVEQLFSGFSRGEFIRELFSRKTLVGTGIFHKWWRMKKAARMERKIYQRCRFFSGRTDWDRTWMERLHPGARYFHVDRVLAENYYRADAWRLDRSEDNRIFVTSSNAAFKGGITLVRALCRLKKLGREDFSAFLAGIHPASSVGKHINRLVRRCGLQDRVHLLGRLQPVELIQEMLRSRLFVLPSHQDNSPNSLAEAMLLGMPCAASNAGGIPSMLEDGKEGRIYRHDSVEALAEVVAELLDHPLQAQAYGKAARQTALQRHNPRKIAQDSYQAYQRVLRIAGEEASRT